MAAGMLPAPGTELGPCLITFEAGVCAHRDCAETRRMANSACEECGQPIGYETRFYNGSTTGQLVHAACLEDRLSR